MREYSNRFWRVIEAVVLVLFVSMFVLAGAQVLFRYYGRFRVPWTEEVARWIYVWQIFLGSGLAAWEGIHLKVDVLEMRLRHRRVASAVHNLAILVLSLLFLVGMLFGSIVMTLSVRGVTAGSFRLSQSIVYLALPVGLGLMIVSCLARIASVVRRVRRRPPISPDEGITGSDRSDI